MEIRTAIADFSSPMRGSGPRTATQTLVFPRNVATATAGLTGYTVEFSPDDDHNLGRVQIQVDTVINANTVTVTATLGLRDWSGDWDDNYDGNIEFVVLADLVSVNAPAPRGDLQIVGLEVNQAVQYFRAASYLDAAHALPDNSIYQIARKNTGIRVYVDFQPDPSLPPIQFLTGQLTVQTPSTTLTFDPINPGTPGSITPHADAVTNLSNANDTLNFMIPAAWCNGSITISARVWDRDAPAQTAAASVRTVVFTDVAPLNLFVVGVTYTAVTPSIPAPTQAQFTSQQLPGLVKTYPVGDVNQIGFATIEFDEVVTGNLNGGCTDGFNDLIGKMQDMQGSSNDVYVAVLGPGILSTPGNQDGGCGTGGVGAIFVDYSGLGDLAHEVGHAFNRKHAPCNHGCNPAPANVDDDYPQYGTFPSDSIGVFGFDATTNTVFNPASTFDFMSYSFPQWVSAYTYAGLNGAFAATRGPTPGSGGAHQLPGVQSEMLKLELLIARDRSVTRKVAFHFGAPGQGALSCVQFTAELLDASGKVLVCQELDCECDSGCLCWPKRVRGSVPWQPDSACLMVWEGDRKIYSEDIPDPPTLKLKPPKTQADGVLLAWSASGGDRKAKDLWYVVHWYDEELRVWRGVAPRTQDTSLLVPLNLFRERDRELAVRVLASSGIATGSVTGTLTLGGKAPGTVALMLAATGEASNSSGVLHAIAVDASGRQLPSHSMSWHDSHGRFLGRGAHFDARSLPHGQHDVRVSVRHTRGGLVTQGWRVQRDGAGVRVHEEAKRTSPKAPRLRRSPRPARRHK